MPLVLPTTPICGGWRPSAGVLMEGHYDVVHFHLPYAAALGQLVVASLPRSARPGVVYTEHSLWDREPLVIRALLRASMRKDEQLVAVSQASHDALPAPLRRRARTVVHGVDLSRSDSLLARRTELRADVRAELGVEPGQLLFMTVANLRPEKGYQVLLDAARTIADRGLPFRIAAVGRGPLSTALHARHVELALGDRFQFLGQRDDVLELLTGVDAFVLPSLHEGLPVTLMEATSVGLPIVATSVGGIPQILEDEVDALLVPPGDPGALVEAMTRLASDPALRERLGRRAKLRSSMFDIVEASRTVGDIYEQVSRGTMTSLVGKRLLHVTTVDMSLALLLGPQLRAFAEAGMEVVGVSAPGPYVPRLEAWGIRHEPLRHATRSMAVGQDMMALTELWRLFRRLKPDIVHTHNPKPGLYGRLAARAAGVPGVVNTVHGLYASPEDRASRRAVVYALERVASLCSGAELVQNPEDLEVLARLGVPRDKLVLLGNGIDLERFRPAADEDGRRRARSVLGCGCRRRSGRNRRAPGAAEGLPGALRGGRAHPRARTPTSSSWWWGDPIRTRPTPSRPRSWLPPVAAVASSSQEAGTTWRTSTAASTCSCCPPTERAFPGRPWKRRRRACR